MCASVCKPQISYIFPGLKDLGNNLSKKLRYYENGCLKYGFQENYWK